MEGDLDDESVSRRAVSSGEPSLDESVDEERAVSDSEIPKIVDTKELAKQVKGPSSDALESDCKKEMFEAAAKDSNLFCKEEKCHENPENGAESEMEVDEDGYEDILGSGDLWKKVLKEGNGERGCSRQWVTVKITSTTNPKDIHEELTYPLGFHWVIDAWELVIQLMKPGEICSVRTAGRFAYGESGRGLNIPPNAPQEYEIELIKLGEIMNFEQMTDEKMKEFFAKMLDQSNYFYRLRMYDKAVLLLNSFIGVIEKELEGRDFKEVKSKTLFNLSYCFDKLRDYTTGLQHINDALKYDTENIKFLTQKYKLLMSKKEFKSAIQILRLLQEKEPEFLVFQEDYDKAEKMMKDQLEQEKLVYKRMLGALGKPTVRTKPQIVQPQRNFRQYIIPVFVMMLAIGCYFIGKYWNFKLF